MIYSICIKYVKLMKSWNTSIKNVSVNEHFEQCSGGVSMFKFTVICSQCLSKDLGMSAVQG